ncbi:DNA polymerase III subunit chi [Pararhodospirillum oryzae]|uniref:DNA polymerase III subunit chi n=1 Tax=Pararhodospirillum oryzae TaxID=478448 RepID=A0A512H6J3_9PROT|nr:DNA polymerase III subunit chi [Pararhodospirillum oryzae]GEO81064.1 DNA polymerase III subunit chi [Pararhodospirillum oryzae]
MPAEALGTRFDFYHLQIRSLEEALPRLLAKIVGQGLRAVVLAASPERVEHLNALLWTWDPSSWLPHGSASDGSADQQPVWLTQSEENPNGASVLVLTDGMWVERPEAFARVLVLFDGRDEQALVQARQRWKGVRDAGGGLYYWQQTEAGGWEEKARARRTPEDPRREEGLERKGSSEILPS